MPKRQYRLGEAVELLKKMPKAKFDETVELAFKLGVDPKQSDQMVRGTVALPHGSGKKVRVARVRERPGSAKQRRTLARISSDLKIW